MSLAADIADAVVATLEAAALSLPITAARAYAPVEDLAEGDGVRVDVVPTIHAATVADVSRRLEHQWVISVWVRERLGTSDPAIIDPLMDLVEEIVPLFAGRPLAGTRAQCVGVENNPAVDGGMLDAKGLFSSGLHLTFRTIG